MIKVSKKPIVQEDVQEKKKPEPKFTKEQILKSTKYQHQTDLLTIVLVDTKSYSLGEVDKAINDYLKRTVK